MLRSIKVLTICATLLFAGCTDDVVRETPPQPAKKKQTLTTSQENTLSGGFASASVSAPDVVSAAKFATKQMNTSLRSIDAASRQVVAGTNYNLKLTTDDRSKYKAVVYQDLKGDFQLTQVKPIKCDIGKAFSPTKKQCIKMTKISMGARGESCIAYLDKSGIPSGDYYWNGDACEKLIIK